MNALESVPQTWDVNDEQFFRIVSYLFACPLVAAAGALLAANDSELTTA